MIFINMPCNNKQGKQGIMFEIKTNNETKTMKFLYTYIDKQQKPMNEETTFSCKEYNGVIEVMKI